MEVVLNVLQVVLEMFVEVFAKAAYQSTDADRRKIVTYNDVYQAVQSAPSRGLDLEFLEGIIPAGQ